MPLVIFHPGRYLSCLRKQSAMVQKSEIWISRYTSINNIVLNCPLHTGLIWRSFSTERQEKHEQLSSLWVLNVLCFDGKTKLDTSYWFVRISHTSIPATSAAFGTRLPQKQTSRANQRLGRDGVDFMFPFSLLNVFVYMHVSHNCPQGTQEIVHVP